MSEQAAVRFRLSLENPQAHLFHLRCEIAQPDPAGQCFSLPAWTPGSYLIRDHARHIVSLRASNGGVPVPVEKLDKHSWRCGPCDGALLIDYELYAFDESVRAAYLDAERGFFDGAAVFLRVQDCEALPHDLEIAGVPAGWQLATALPAASESGYHVPDYAALIDHPVLMGRFLRIPFEVTGIPHELVLEGLGDWARRVDAARLAQDLARICSAQQRLFGDALPFTHYQFLTRVLPRAYGGLEHRNSCALLCSRNDLPLQDNGSGQPLTSPSYRSFLGLCSHEYFHLWNVKRIRPQNFADNGLDREAYTRDLWAYEGITSYYDDLAMLRGGAIAPPEYLDVLAQAATRLWRTPGRQRQSLADSSFDAWIKFYRSDENTPNSQVSYYNKGALVALSLDLYLRLHTLGACSLDDVMRGLWQRHGARAQPVPERGLEKLASELSGLDLQPFFDRYLRGTEELPLQHLLTAFGVEARLRLPVSEQDSGGRTAAVTALRADLGLRTNVQQGRLLISHVFDGSAAQIAGLHPGDELIALNRLRIEPAEWGARVGGLNPNEQLEISVFRRDELRSFAVIASERTPDTWTFTLATDPAADALARRQAWLSL